MPVRRRTCHLVVVRTNRRAALALTVVLLSAPACSGPPLEWSSHEYVPPRAGPAAVDDPRLCGGTEASLGDLVFRAGWSRDTGELLVLKSPDGGVTWEDPVVAEGRERGASVCDRPVPSLFADSVNNFLHLAYFAEPRGGAGVYYVHSMDAQHVAQTGSGMFEPPIAITYGTRPVRTSVVSRGDTVVVAYEDPNSPRGGVHVALSHTAGHSFDSRFEGSVGSASAPAAALRAGELIVEWREAVAPFRSVRRRGSFR
jgi:hypothetical protein